MTQCAHRLLELLVAHGIETVFGIPGVHTVELYRGLPDSGLRHVTPRHEQGAGFMADGYARATGKPAACFIISGPGMTNIATAMGQALADSVPMLVISSVNRRDTLGRGQGRLHELPDQQRTLSGVSVFSHTLQTPEALPEVLGRAFAVFKSARPGPVHIEIPLDVMALPAPEHRPRIAEVFPPTAPDAALAWAADWLADAERPLVLLGGGCVAAGDAVRTLVERLDAPAMTTINAKGVLGCGHPLDLGACASLPAGRKLARHADVVLALGTELGETDYDLTFDGGFRLDGRLIRVDIDAQQLARNHATDLALLADTGEAALGLLERLPPQAAREGAARVADTRAALALRDADDVAPYADFLDTLREALPDATIVGDSTGPVYAGNFIAEMPAPRRWFNAATGYGTLGYGLPAALGAALGVPERPVIALVGDGGLMFTLAEIATAREAGVPLAIVIWNNAGYGEIRRYMDAQDVPRLGVDLAAPDFVTLAKSLDCYGVRVSTRAALHQALQASRQAPGPTLIDVEADRWSA
ncbi:acetolactate synthase-1/2/3 large subunit [Chromohalobacter marismortui]|uniref:Acetolactate synthase-1/2/3 large subunit n=1 Tax=Chromohalobacter marismortui TaxID=42055 RepID=A0A4R7NTQ7_9GAMM|nr:MULTISPECIES: 5-guanidino-2-oxopentanoate decarboxylase [Chromohalobacter]MCI0509021.1 5-guanidino-2-oxopentanoate decarboxylase [Chromohalobacter sp.]MCI0592874.1 5-guanidino-2-oxopentanoate decarboxylase [Chromohalobacter sp.]TDU24089.1 acetolactate synthase-1/2/3 large subunit [Chromohalobacter marismortui]